MHELKSDKDRVCDDIYPNPGKHGRLKWDSILPLPIMGYGCHVISPCMGIPA